MTKHRGAIALAGAAVLLAAAATARAQGFGDPGAGAPPPRALVARDGAPVDFTGYWISVVGEDWRLRMYTPAKNDYTGIPMSAEGRRLAESWDPDRDRAEGNECRAWGVANLLRMPTRLRFRWEDQDTLRIDSDHGEQTRMLHFDGPKYAAGQPLSWQGDSAAQWDGRTLKVVTRNMRSGYLRRNGVPYSEQTVVTEYFDLHSAPDGETRFTVTTIVEDPRYLWTPYITTSDFKKLRDGDEWNPTPCTSEWGPLRVLEDVNRFN